MHNGSSTWCLASIQILVRSSVRGARVTSTQLERSLNRKPEIPARSSTGVAQIPLAKEAPNQISLEASCLLHKMAPQVGLEPTTLRLTAGCSAIELLRSVCALPTARQLVAVL